MDYSDAEMAHFWFRPADCRQWCYCRHVLASCVRQSHFVIFESASACVQQIEIENRNNVNTEHRTKKNG